VRAFDFGVEAHLHDELEIFDVLLGDAGVALFPAAALGGVTGEGPVDRIALCRERGRGDQEEDRDFHLAPSRPKQ
jgi:hypothetical protein